jgi:mannosyltransferase OCH1-like enzyme
MRSVYVFFALAIPSLTLLYLRHHIQVLSEVFKTYSTFYSYLEKHHDVLYRFNEDDLTPPTPDLDETYFVPRHIHQIYLTEGGPSNLEKYQAAIESCQDKHAGWNHTIWTDQSSSEFMQTHYPTIFPHYKNYKQTIQRANVLRYALLDHFGGVYIDLDVTCRRSLEPLRAIPWMTPAAHPAGVNNAFIQSRVGHPFLGKLLAALPNRDLSWGLPYIENMFSTGCMFFSNMWMSYARSNIDSKNINKVYILADPQGDINPHMLRGVITTPLFKHGGASSWHGWDAAAIVLIGKHYPIVLQGCLVLSLLMVVLLWRAFGGRNRRRRSSWGVLMNKAIHSAGPQQSARISISKDYARSPSRV